MNKFKKDDVVCYAINEELRVGYITDILEKKIWVAWHEIEIYPDTLILCSYRDPNELIKIGTLYETFN